MKEYAYFDYNKYDSAAINIKIFLILNAALCTNFDFILFKKFDIINIEVIL